MRRAFHCLIFLSVVSGCTSALFESRMLNVREFALEQRVVNQFSDALREDNEAALRNSASTRFEQKAMRAETAFKDLEILNLPKGKLIVVESEEINDTTRHVVVTEEEDEDEKYQFHLVRDDAKRRWVVDDVVFRQQKKGARGTKSSTEVMDLLLTLREFLDTWKEGDREAMLQAVAPKLRTPLQELPEPWLKQLIGRVTSEYDTDMARRPEAQLNESDAVVKLPGRNGFLLVKIARQDDSWLVSDVEVHNRRIEDHPGSILRQARAMNTVTRFLEGYQKQDHTLLKSSSSEAFYQGSLQFADLSMISLPAPDFAPDEFELRAFSGQLTIMIPDKTQLVRIDLMDPLKQGLDAEGKPLTTVITKDDYEFLVREVTVYDRKTMQQTNLSSAFSAPARAMLFMSALADRDVEMLRQISTQEFSKGTWDRLPPDMIGQLPLQDIPRGEITLISSRVRGQQTELEFQATSGQLLNCILSSENDSLHVDDVQFPNQSAQIVSLKTQLELTIPLMELALAWKQSDLNAVQKSCSTEFNRLVWSNLQELPADFTQMPNLLSAPIQSSEVSQNRANVQLQSPGQARTTVRFLAENGYWMIDEVAFEGKDGVAVEMRSALRRDIAQRFLQAPAGTIQQAAYSTQHRLPGTSPASGVIRAHAEAPATVRGNLTLPSPRKPMPAKRIDTVVPDLSAEKPVDVAPAVPPQVSEEHDGIIYFRPTPSAAAPSAAAGSSAEPAPEDDTEPHPLEEVAPQALKPVPTTRRITDPSEFPIDIPVKAD